MIRYLTLVVICGALPLLPGAMVLSPPSDCHGAGANLVGTPPVWTLDCLGTCPSPNNCEKRTGSDAQGAFVHCGCRNSDVEDCCNTILRANAADPPTYTPEAKGDCPACPLTGVCTLQTISPTEKQAGCD
jgi:hypothetical protein